MKLIQHIKDLYPETDKVVEKDTEVRDLFDGPFRKIIEISLQRGAVLSRHKANEPITVFCISGTGVFRAGSDLEDSQDLRAGTLITLEAGIDHEVVADPALHILVTKFKAG
jgi:quercetin dioxygenase-like cupin family protein